MNYINYHKQISFCVCLCVCFADVRSGFTNTRPVYLVRGLLILAHTFRYTDVNPECSGNPIYAERRLF